MKIISKPIKPVSNMKWITRERPKIDRIACPWLIKNFIDKEAQFIYVPVDKVKERSKELNAIPFDVPDVEFTHHQDKCTFDSLIEKYEIGRSYELHLRELERTLWATVKSEDDSSRIDLAPYIQIEDEAKFPTQNHWTSAALRAFQPP